MSIVSRPIGEFTSEFPHTTLGFKELEQYLAPNPGFWVAGGSIRRLIMYGVDALNRWHSKGGDIDIFSYEEADEFIRPQNYQVKNGHNSMKLQTGSRELSIVDAIHPDGPIETIEGFDIRCVKFAYSRNCIYYEEAALVDCSYKNICIDNPHRDPLGTAVRVARFATEGFSCDHVQMRKLFDAAINDPRLVTNNKFHPRGGLGVPGQS